jgi:signal peptidase I
LDKPGRNQDSSFGGVRSVLLAALVAIAFRSTAVQAFSIPSGSATPTMLTGDTVLVSKFAYGYSRYSLPFAPGFLHGRLFGRDPKRGDYAVFANPVDGVVTIKRIVGLPGDRIQVTGGIVSINGQVARRVPAGSFVERDWDEAAGQEVAIRRYRYVETLPSGVVHDILGSPVTEPEDAGPADNTGVYLVPAGHYFGMGDSRDNSADSRFLDQLGYIPAENLIGRAEFRLVCMTPGAHLWQVWTWSTTMRLGRFFGAII